MENLICGLNADAIEALKKKHGFVFEVTVSDGEKEYKAICKEPTMEAMEASSTVGKTNDLKASMVLYDNCVLHADTDITNRFLLKVQIIKALGEKMNGLSVTTKNL